MKTPVVRNRCWMVAGVLLILSLPGWGRSLFLANFNQGLDAVYPAGEAGKAGLSSENQAEDVQLMPGKFGQGVHIGAVVPASVLAYTPDISASEGTLEFWFRPETSLVGPTNRCVMFFSTESDPNGLRLLREPPGWLCFWNYRDYDVKACIRSGVGITGFQQNAWAHMAVAWDATEGRLFFNGRLVAMSDRWVMPEVMLNRVFLVLGGPVYAVPKTRAPSGAGGVFDDLLISDTKRYISSFVPPQQEAVIEKEDPVPPVPAKCSEQERRQWQAESVLFFADFRSGITVATFAKGSLDGFANQKLTVDKLDAAPALTNTVHPPVAAPINSSPPVFAVRLVQPAENVGGTLCFQARNNINLRRGRVEVSLKFDGEMKLPVVVFDTTRLTHEYVYMPGNATPDHAQGRSGMRLIINSNACLEWQSLDNNRLSASVRSTPLVLTGNDWHQVGFSWIENRVTLYNAGKPVAQAADLAMPSLMDRYFFVGSDSQAQNGLNGWVRKILITGNNQ